MVSTATFSAWSLGYRTTDGPAWQSDEAGRAGCSTQHFRSNSFLVILIILVILVTRNSRHASATLQTAILCLGGAFPAPSLLRSGPLSPPSWTALLLIYRIQSHTHPKRRKFCLKHAGRKSVKEELPERRKGPKRAAECRLKVPTHVWEQDAAGSNPITRIMASVLIAFEKL